MPQVFTSHRESSRVNYGETREKDSPPTIEQINCGSLMRIADSLEQIATVLRCPNAQGMARALIRMDKRLAKKIKL